MLLMAVAPVAVGVAQQIPQKIKVKIPKRNLMIMKKINDKEMTL